jgi:hypothetical protein
MAMHNAKASKTWSHEEVHAMGRKPYNISYSSSAAR